MTAVPGTLVRDAVPASTRSHFSAAPWCTALFSNPELVAVRLTAASGSSAAYSSTDSFVSQTQAFYKPALPPPPPTTAPSLTPYEPYRPSALSTVGQLHTLHGIAPEAGRLDAAGLDELAAALLSEQARALLATDPDPATTGFRLGELTVRHRRPIKADMPVLCRAWKASGPFDQSRRYVVGADLIFGPGEVLSSAEFVFVEGSAAGARL